jgi:ABC-type uncharacterized transport system permease subunit
MLQSIKNSSASVFLYLVGAGFGGIVGFQIITKTPVDAIALSFLYGTVTYAVNSMGVKNGVDHTNSTVEHVAQVQYPMTPAGISAVQQESDNVAAIKAEKEKA